MVMLVQKPTSGFTPPIVLRVTSQDAYAELFGVQNEGKEYLFTLKYKLDLTNVKDPAVYEKLIIQIKRKDAAPIAVSIDNQVIKDSITSQKKVNPFQDTDVFSKTKLVNPLPKSPQSKYPAKVSEKLYSGVKALSDFELKDDVVTQEIVWVNSFINESLSSVYSTVQLKRLTYVNDPQSYSGNNSNEYLDSDEVIRFVNKNSFTFSQYNMPGIDQSSTPQIILNDYFYNKVKEKNVTETQYEIEQIEKIPEEVTIPVVVVIPSENKDLNLDVICSLYKVGSEIPVETLKNNLYMPNYVEEFESLSTRASVPMINVNKVDQIFTIFSVFTSEEALIKEKNLIRGYNIYRRLVQQSGALSKPRLVGRIQVAAGDYATPKSFRALATNELQIYRVVPVYANNKESHLFRDVVVGPGYPVLGSFTITVYDTKAEKNSTTIEINNIPKGTKNISLYKREVNSSNEFKVVESIFNNNFFDRKNLTINHKTLGVGNYEYFVLATIDELNSYSRYQEKLMVSNAVAHYRSELDQNQNINVTLSEIKDNSTDLQDPSLSFVITTGIEQTQSQLVISQLQSQILELYKKYVEPQNTADVAEVGNQTIPGLPKYSDLFLHEVIRTNMNTGEREVFELVGEGLFEDKNLTRAKRGIRPIDPQSTYEYHVISYSRNPIELFKNFIAKGIRTDLIGDKREWFYLPYKWLNPQTKRGVLYPTDNEGVPIIPEVESLKSNTYGLTARYRVEGIKDQVEISQVLANRISTTSVKVSWQVKGSTIKGNSIKNPYDSFLVFAVVNGKKKFIGVTSTTFIYHKLENNRPQLELNDYGSIYYIIIPVLEQLYLDTVAYSNDIKIDPDGLHQPIKLPNTVFEYRYKNKVRVR